MSLNPKVRFDTKETFIQTAPDGIDKLARLFSNLGVEDKSSKKIKSSHEPTKKAAEKYLIHPRSEPKRKSSLKKRLKHTDKKTDELRAQVIDCTPESSVKKMPQTIASLATLSENSMTCGVVALRLNNKTATVKGLIHPHSKLNTETFLKPHLERTDEKIDGSGSRVLDCILDSSTKKTLWIKAPVGIEGAESMQRGAAALKLKTLYKKCKKMIRETSDPDKWLALINQMSANVSEWEKKDK